MSHKTEDWNDRFDVFCVVSACENHYDIYLRELSKKVLSLKEDVCGHMMYDSFERCVKDILEIEHFEVHLSKKGGKEDHFEVLLDMHGSFTEKQEADIINLFLGYVSNFLYDGVLLQRVFLDNWHQKPSRVLARGYRRYEQKQKKRRTS